MIHLSHTQMQQSQTHVTQKHYVSVLISMITLWGSYKI